MQQMMQQLQQSPAIQNMLGNPDMLRSMLQNNPMVQQNWQDGATQKAGGPACLAAKYRPVCAFARASTLAELVMQTLPHQ
eukprot:scaffold69197_cov21-Tisochrysis_lutea.AAC.3